MELKEFFLKYPKVAIAFSGGADSAFLAYNAKKYAEKVKAYCFKSQFQPRFELEDALRIASELGVELEIINADLSENPSVFDNSRLRCYYCKKNMLEIIAKKAFDDGYDVIIDGTNASDLKDERPGMRALNEVGVLSPLKMCSITKSEVYSMSAQAGISTCRKPSYSCLATRIPMGMRITDNMLKKVEKSEACLYSLGLSDFRLRVISEEKAKLQVKREQFEKASDLLDDIRDSLKSCFNDITIDTEVFR